MKVRITDKVLWSLFVATQRIFSLKLPGDTGELGTAYRLAAKVLGELIKPVMLISAYTFFRI